MIGMAKHTTKTLHRRILWDLIRVHIECCGAVRRAIVEAIRARPTAAGNSQRVPMLTLVSVVPAHPSTVFLFSGLLKLCSRGLGEQSPAANKKVSRLLRHEV